MSWPRESLFAAIFALSAPWALADTITVNTTKDDFADNDLCSLREAVEFFNLGKPADGFQGCKTLDQDSYAVISLPASATPYVIGSTVVSEDLGAIFVKVPLTINGAGRSGAIADATTIEVKGAHRAFVLNYNPVYLKPRCALSVTPTCASHPGEFNLNADFDSGTPGDYLTTAHAPEFEGSLPGVPAPVPPAVLPAHSFLIRVYDYPATGDRVEVGKTLVSVSTSAMPWSVRASRQLKDGVHDFRYTVEELDALTGATVTEESDPKPARLTVAIHTKPERYTIRLSQLRLKGCGLAGGCANNVDDNVAITNDPDPANASYDSYALSYTNGLVSTDGNGGVIFNNEALILADVLVRDGVATRGGAVHLAVDGAIKLEQSDVRGNTAVRGAGIHASVNAVTMETSLLTDNVVTDALGAVVEVDSATVPPGLAASRIVNSTLSGNEGRALSLREGAIVNSSTIVLNAGGGIVANSARVDVYNTILAGNLPGADCQDFAAESVFKHDLLQAGGGCPAGVNLQVISGAAGTAQQLIAGTCTDQYGLLCPLADHGGATPVHMPRVLQDYDLHPALLGASPIINKGSVKVGGSEAEACSSQDQRTRTRLAFSCDIGSVELQAVAPGAAIASGGSIVQGASYSQYIGMALEDEVLLPAAKCLAGVTPFAPANLAVYPPPSLAPDPSLVVADSYRADIAGCPWIEKAASRGEVTFSSDSRYVYRPTVVFHGYDRFDIRVVTTLSTLNPVPGDRSRLVKAQVIVEPSSSLVSSKLSGASDLWILLALLLLGGAWRRGGKV